MKLLLTSDGLKNKKISDFLVSILPKAPPECSVLMIAYVQNENERFYVNESKKELVELGIKDISFFNLEERKFSDFKNYDIIYVCGGNTFAILNRMRITRIDYSIKELVGKGSLYFGVSAGSIIAGPSIEISGWGSEGDKNEVDLEDLGGLNFTNISVFPHFKDNLEIEIEQYCNKVSFPVIKLADSEAVFIDDTGYKIIH